MITNLISILRRLRERYDCSLVEHGPSRVKFRMPGGTDAACDSHGAGDPPRRHERRGIGRRSLTHHVARTPSLFFALLLTAAGTSLGQSPNLVYVMFDDLGYGDLGVYGSPSILTPTIDALAGEGMRLTRYSTNAAVCSPTRAGILSGRYPAALGILRVLQTSTARGIPDDVPTLAELLRDQGYVTAHVGKWHLGEASEEYLPPAKGFDYSVRIILSATHFDNEVVIDEGMAQPTVGHSTDVLTDFALGFLNQQIPSVPFYLNLWYTAPHTPLEAPSEWEALYPDTDEGRYAAMVSHLDARLQDLLAALEANGLAADTLVIVTSDNGGGSQAHPTGNGTLQGFKGTLFEGGLRVPFIARWPGHVPPATVNDSAVVSSDLLPTMGDLVGFSTPSVDGESVVEVLVDNKHRVRSGDAYWTAKRGSGEGAEIRGSFAITRDDWKLLYHLGERRLYDLAADPEESTDLAEDEPATTDSMWAAYWRWKRDAARVAWEVGSLNGAAQEIEDGYEFSGGSVTLVEDPRFMIHDGDFTVMLVVRPSSLDADQTLAQKPATWELRLLAGGLLMVTVRGEDGSQTSLISQASLALDEPTAVGITTYGEEDLGTTLRLFVDGALEAEATELVPLASTETGVWLGNNSDLTLPFFGELTSIEFHTLDLSEHLEGLVGDELFSDGFEFGDTSAWDSTVQ